MGDFRLDKVVLENAGMKALLNEDFVRDELTRRAGRTLTAVESADPEHEYHIEQATTDRAAVRVGSDDEGVLFAESATGDLLRSLDAAAGSS